MGGNYFVIGTFFGIQLRIDYSWFIIFALIAWAIITVYIPSYRHGLSPVALTAAGLTATVLFFISVIAHEYAHSLVANRRGLKIKRITLYIFGGASELQQEPNSAKTELYMTAAGPLTSFVAAGIFAGLLLLARHWHITALEIVFQPVAVLNFVVAVFNLIPAFPLDGGRILRSIIWLVRKDFITATRSATNVGMFFSYLLMGFGLLEIAANNLIGGLWFIIIGFFLLQSARFSYTQVIQENVLSGVAVSDVMNKQFSTVPKGTLVSNFFSEFVLRFKQYDFIVTDGAGKPLGIIELPQVSRISRTRPKALIDDYVQPLTEDLTLKPRDHAAKALKIMQSHNLDILPVISNKKLVGVVMRRYLEDHVMVHRLQQR